MSDSHYSKALKTRIIHSNVSQKELVSPRIFVLPAIKTTHVYWKRVPLMASSLELTPSKAQRSYSETLWSTQLGLIASIHFYTSIYVYYDWGKLNQIVSHVDVCSNWPLTDTIWMFTSPLSTFKNSKDQICSLIFTLVITLKCKHESLHLWYVSLITAHSISDLDCRHCKLFLVIVARFLFL